MPVADTRLYDVLGVSPSASAAEIKKAYKRLALKHHPDKGGDVRKFQEMTAAHAVLTDERKRSLYDRFGEEGLRQASTQGGGGAERAGAEGGPPFFAANDFFDMLFRSFGGDAGGVFGGGGAPGAGGFGAFRSQPRRPAPGATPGDAAAAAVVKVKVTLEEAFLGSVKRLAVQRPTPCAPCAGTGAAGSAAGAAGAGAGAAQRCSRCGGAGVVVVERRSGFFLERSEVTCPDCQGEGRCIPPEARCTSCGGRGVRTERHIHELRVPPGARSGQRFAVRSAAPGAEAGVGAAELLFECIFEVMEHPRFERSGDDLLIGVEVPLAAALGGGPAAEVEHLDGRRLLLRLPPGRVAGPGSRWRLRGEGMPILGQAPARGDLWVQLSVAFPDRLDAATAARVAALLRGGRAGGGGAGVGAGVAGGALEAVLEPASAEEERDGGGTRSRL